MCMYDESTVARYRSLIGAMKYSLPSIEEASENVRLFFEAYDQPKTTEHFRTEYLCRPMPRRLCSAEADELIENIRRDKTKSMLQKCQEIKEIKRRRYRY